MASSAPCCSATASVGATLSYCEPAGGNTPLARLSLERDAGASEGISVDVPAGVAAVLCLALVLEILRRGAMAQELAISSARRMGKAPRCLETNALYSESVKRKGCGSWESSSQICWPTFLSATQCLFRMLTTAPKEVCKALGSA